MIAFPCTNPVTCNIFTAKCNCYFQSVCVFELNNLGLDIIIRIIAKLIPIFVNVRCMGSLGCWLRSIHYLICCLTIRKHSAICVINYSTQLVARRICYNDFKSLIVFQSDSKFFFSIKRKKTRQFPVIKFAFVFGRNFLHINQ